MVLSLEEEYGLGNDPISIDGRVMSLDELEDFSAGDLLGKKVTLFGHLLDMQLQAVYSDTYLWVWRARDLLDLDSFAKKQDIEDGERIMREVKEATKKRGATQRTYRTRDGLGLSMRFEVKLAESSMAVDYWYLFDSSAFDVLSDYTFMVFSPIYDNC